MNASLRAALAAGALALAATSASASSVTIAPGSVDLVSDTLYQDNPHPAPNTPVDGWMAITVLSGVTGALFKLADTSTDGYTVNYQLYTADHSTAIGAGWTMQDIGTQAQNLALSGVYKALSAGSYAVKLSFANFDQGSFTASTQVSAVPLPGAALLFGSALMGLGALRRKQKSGEKSEMAAA